MNTLRNKVQLIGNLGNDPEIITLDSGKNINFLNQNFPHWQILIKVHFKE